MSAFQNKKHQFVQKCINLITNQQKFYVLTQQQYIELLTEVQDAYSATRKTTKQRRRMAKYEVYEDIGRNRLIKKGSSAEPVYVLTIDEIFDALDAAHASTGHGGRDRMMHVSRHYQNLTRSMVEIYLSLCLICHEKKSLSNKGIVTKPMLMERYLEKMQIDLVDMQSKPDGQFKWILTCADHFTKRVSLRALCSKRGAKVAHALIDIFAETGVPEEIQNDCGREFRNKHVKTLALLFTGIKFKRSKPRKPSTNGLVEAANKDIKNMLFCWMRENKTSLWVFGKCNGCLKT